MMQVRRRSRGGVEKQDGAVIPSSCVAGGSRSSLYSSFTSSSDPSLPGEDERHHDARTQPGLECRAFAARLAHFNRSSRTHATPCISHAEKGSLSPLYTINGRGAAIRR